MVRQTAAGSRSPQAATVPGGPGERDTATSAGGMLRVIHQWVRPLLPSEPVVYGGIPIGRRRHWGDRRVPPSWVPKDLDDIPTYEATLAASLRRHVRPGDSVVVVGGGAGVTAVVAAQAAGPTGRVVCYEAGAELVKLVRATAACNGLATRLRVEHAVVARAVDVWGSVPQGPVVSPESLPACDVLELDCEGAEIDILSALSIRPRALLVETHGLFGAPTEHVLSLLDGLGYRAEVVGVAEERYQAYCEENDIRIVEAVRLDA